MPGRFQIFAVLLFPSLLLFLTGCPTCPPAAKILTPPPALTLDEQLHAAEARARAVPMLAARGTAHITWTDDKGHHDERTDAALRIGQRYDADALKNGGGDVYLVGTFAGQEQFQAGRNPDKFWFLVRLDVKTAWVGNSAAPATPSTAANLRAPLRADLLIDLLGIAQLAIDPRQTVFQRYNDSPTAPEVDLLVLMPGPTGKRYLQRAITLDRMTGRVSHVTIYDLDGLPLVSSQLSDYRDAPYRDGDKYRAEVPIKLPYKVSIRYARQSTLVELAFDEMSIPSKLPPTVFTTPDFPAEGLKVVPVE
jgi:hypothetical protein